MRLVEVFRKLGDRAGIHLILLIASISRLWNLHLPKDLVFDETYYVKDSYTLWRFGHETQWPVGANSDFIAGNLGIVTNEPQFVVHAPLGKWLIGLGMQVFGPANPFGWRVIPAVFGILAVWLVYLAAVRLIGSKRWALLPAFMLAVDGQAIVVSRTAILDGILATFLLLGFYLLLRSLTAEKPWGWLALMALTLGLGAGVKWSALIFLAVFVAYFMIHAGWHWKVILSRSYALFALPVAITAYLATWAGWFLTQGWGYRKNDVIASFIDFHQQMYRFHSTLQTPHPYEASPLTWLGMLRPTSFYYEESGSDVVAINPLGNPIFWAAGIVALGFLFSWFATNRDRLSLLVFSGYLAGYFPWILYSERTAFQFYSATFAPWIFLTITLMAYRYKLRRTVALGAVGAFLLFLYFLPLYLGIEIPFWFWASHMWLPTWV